MLAHVHVFYVVLCKSVLEFRHLGKSLHNVHIHVCSSIHTYVHTFVVESFSLRVIALYRHIFDLNLSLLNKESFWVKTKKVSGRAKIIFDFKNLR